MKIQGDKAKHHVHDHEKSGIQHMRKLTKVHQWDMRHFSEKNTWALILETPSRGFASWAPFLRGCHPCLAQGRNGPTALVSFAAASTPSSTSYAFCLGGNGMDMPSKWPHQIEATHTYCEAMLHRLRYPGVP